MTHELSILEKPQTKKDFVKIFMAVNNCSPAEAEQMFVIETFSFARRLHEDGELADTTELSQLGVFLDVISSGLSFSPAVEHVFLEYRTFKVKKPNGQKIDEKRLVYENSADGEIFLCQKAGSVELVTEPVIVYNCDMFQIKSTFDGSQYPIHEITIPRLETAKVSAAYCYVETPEGKRHFFYMFMDDVARLKKYSERNNAKKVLTEEGRTEKKPGNANPLYNDGPDGDIDTGFLKTKLRKFAVKGWRKKKLHYKNAEPVELLNESEPDAKKSEEQPTAETPIETLPLTVAVPASAANNVYKTDF